MQKHNFDDAERPREIPFDLKELDGKLSSGISLIAKLRVISEDELVRTRYRELAQAIIPCIRSNQFGNELVSCGVALVGQVLRDINAHNPLSSFLALDDVASE